MPFQSEKQKKWMWANKPEMAREWTSKYGSKIEAKKGIMAKKDKNWIQKATKNMRKDKPCTGKKFGGPTCPPGTRRYNLAKTFRKMNKAATGTMVKADTGKWITKKKTTTPWITKKKKADPMADTEHMRTKKQWWIKKKKTVGDEAKGGTYTPGWKPQLSVRTAKRGIFNKANRAIGALPFVKGKASTNIGLGKPSTFLKRRMILTGKKGMPPATKYKEYLRSMRKATSSKFPANAFTAGKTALGAQQLKAHLKTKLPKGATSTLSKAARIAKATRYGKIALGIAAAGVAAKEVLKKDTLFPLVKSKKKVQKKSTGGEIIIGRGVDIDLL